MTELPETHLSLIVRLRRADGDSAWGTFLEIYEPAILRFAMSRGLQQADALDVTQQVLVAVNDKLASWQGNPNRGSFRGWLFRTTRNLAAKSLRAKRRRLESSPQDVQRFGHVTQLDELPQSSEEEASAFCLEYRRQVFRVAAESVRPQFHASSWQAFWRTSVLGETASHVANELGVSVGAVYTAKCRIMTRLKEVVQQFSEYEIEIDP